MGNSEIAMAVSREENIEKYFPHFANQPLSTSEFPNLKYGRVVTADAEYYGLMSDDHLCGVLILNSDRLDKPQIMYTQTELAYRGKGLLRYLFNHALQHHDTMYSDDHHTTESKQFWQGIIQIQQPSYKVYVYDIAKDSYTLATADMFDEIWNGDPSIILAAKKRGMTVAEAAYHQRSNEVRKRFNRSDFELYYGEYPANTGYINP